MLLIDWPNTIYVTVNFARTLASSDPLALERDGRGRCQTISHGRIAGSIVCFLMELYFLFLSAKLK
jgi:hypothetical protein